MITPNRCLYTSDLARAVGIHPNTVRLYETWGLLPPVERSPSGYRRFTRFHLDCLRLAYGGQYPGTALRRSAALVARQAASGDLGGALELAYRHKALVQAERAQAEAAAALLERWAGGVAADATGKPLQIGATAKLLGASIDMLRRAGKRELADPFFLRQWWRLVIRPRSDIERHFAWMKHYFGLKYFQCFIFLRVNQLVLLTYIAALAVALAAQRYDCPELVRSHSMVLAHV